MLIPVLTRTSINAPLIKPVFLPDLFSMENKGKLHIGLMHASAFHAQGIIVGIDLTIK